MPTLISCALRGPALHADWGVQGSRTRSHRHGAPHTTSAAAPDGDVLSQDDLGWKEP